MSACPTKYLGSWPDTSIFIFIQPSQKVKLFRESRLGDLAECPGDSSERCKVSFAVLLSVITKLSHAGSTGLSRLSQGWAGSCFLGGSFSDRHIGSKHSQAGGPHTQSLAGRPCRLGAHTRFTVSQRSFGALLEPSPRERGRTGPPGRLPLSGKSVFHTF